jgi:hypothetical protein
MNHSLALLVHSLDLETFRSMFTHKILVKPSRAAFFSALGIGLIQSVETSQNLFESIEVRKSLERVMEGLGLNQDDNLLFFQKFIHSIQKISDFLDFKVFLDVINSIGYSLWMICSYINHENFPGNGNLTNDFDIENNEILLDKICKKLKITLILIKNKGENKYFGCEYRSLIVPLFKEPDNYFSVLIHNQALPDKKKFPFLYTLDEGVRKLILCLQTLIKKKLNPNEKKLFLSKIESVYNDKELYYLLPKKLIKLFKVNQLDKCNHESFSCILAVCNNYHCVQCLYRLTQGQERLKWECLCNRRISPKNYEQLCRKYEKILNKNKSKSTLNANGFKIDQKASFDFKAKPPLVQDTEQNSERNTFKCNNCTSANLQFDFGIKCESHRICISCRSRNTESCIVCNRKYDQIEKSTIIKIANEFIVNDSTNLNKDSPANTYFSCAKCNKTKIKPLKNPRYTCHEICNKCSHNKTKCPVCSNPIT